MNLQPSFVRFAIDPAFYALWQALYALVAAFLFVARIGLAFKELSAITVEPNTNGNLAVPQNSFETTGT